MHVRPCMCTASRRQRYPTLNVLRARDQFFQNQPYLIVVAVAHACGPLHMHVAIWQLGRMLSLLAPSKALALVLRPIVPKRCDPSRTPHASRWHLIVRPVCSHVFVCVCVCVCVCVSACLSPSVSCARSTPSTPPPHSTPILHAMASAAAIPDRGGGWERGRRGASFLALLHRAARLHQAWTVFRLDCVQTDSCHASGQGRAGCKCSVNPGGAPPCLSVCHCQRGCVAIEGCVASAPCPVRRWGVVVDADKLSVVLVCGCACIWSTFLSSRSCNDWGLLW